MLIKEELPACPVATTVQLIGNKWKLLILRNLLARLSDLGESMRSILESMKAWGIYYQESVKNDSL